MKKTSSYKKEDKKKTGRADKYKKTPAGAKSNVHTATKVTDVTPQNSTKDSKKERIFNPYYNKQAHKYKIKCIVCEQEKMVAVKPIEGVPVICDECLIDIEARRLLDKGGFQKTKKLTCKWCGEVFYGLNETYLFCDSCYDKFSHEIKARNRGLEKYTCDNCNTEGWLHPKTIKEKREKGLPVLCRTCMNKEEEKQKKEKSKNRINKVKKRVKKDTDA